MFRKKTILSPLELRKQLLIAESEINRDQLLQQWQTLAGEFHSLAEHARTLNTVTSTIMPLVAGLGAFASGRLAPKPEQTSWLQRAISAARLASSIWALFHSSSSDSDKK